jgi:hypothetical protein
MNPHTNSQYPARQPAKRFSALLAGLALAAAAFAQSPGKQQPPSAPLDMENAQVVHLEHLWLDAQNTGNVAELDRILAADFVRPYPPDGQFITKAEMMTYLHSHPFPHQKGPHPHFAQLRVRIYGNVAIARGILTTQDANGALLSKTLFTDVFLRRQGRWQAVSAQENQVPQH